MREMDRRTIEEQGTPGLVLMERAGRGIVRVLALRFGPLHRRVIAVVCGKGNNGGDGLVVARLLRARGLWPRLVLTAPVDQLSPDARVNAERAQAAGLALEVGDPDRSLRGLSERDLLLDGLLGTGLDGPARGSAAAWIEAMQRCPAATIAIDIPSGLSSDSGELPGPAVRAIATISMAAPKQGALFPPARDHWGECFVVDIGIPEEISAAVGESAWLAGGSDLVRRLPAPGGATHKGDWGKLIVVGGSPGMIGAPTLAAGAALRMGAGLVRVALPRSLAPVFASRSSEAMTVLLPEGEDGQPLASGAERLLSDFGSWDALAIGPGLGRSPEAERLVLRLLGKWRGPMVADADALNALAAFGSDSWVPRAREIRAAGVAGGLVLTPHHGEMQRLSGVSIEEQRRDPLAIARVWAERWGVTLLLKGAPSVIASPLGVVHVNATGNSGLATGGSGDVLSGIIGALLAQGASGPDAALLGSHLHGLAADLVVSKPSSFAQRSLLPGDVIEALPRAIASLQSGEIPPRQRIWSVA
ncbi:MAG: NAD(P)H-hydrate dehydratase [Candidatus Eisenbacteria bacterium]